MVSAPARQARAYADRVRDRSGPGQLTARRALLWLVAIAGVSAAVRMVLVQLVQAPTVFNDELGYARLAQSIGLEGRLAVLGNEGFSYSPLYPVLLAPIYALGASAATAYALVKVVNAVLISLAIFPLYKIARFALPRRASLIAAGLCAVAPVMSYPAFTMSENLAFPLCAVALWAMLAAIREPSAGRDLVLLAAVGAATAARIQLIVLVPAAVTAVALAAAAGPGPRRLRRVGDAVKAHWVLFGAVGASALAAGALVLTGGDIASAFGRYGAVWRAGLPDPWEVVVLAVHHLAGLDLAVGVIPFVGTVVAAVIFVRAGLPERPRAFAAVAASFSAWLLLEVAIDAALFDGAGGDLPRIHERFLIYAVPLFLIAFVASLQAQRPRRVVLAAAALAALLPALIPFAKYVNDTNVVDTFGLLPFGRAVGQARVAVPHATLAAVAAGVALALIYVRLGSRSLRSAAAVLVALSALVWIHAEKASTFSRSFLPERTDWVDRARPSGEVVLIGIGGDGSPAALQTAYGNLAISKVYALCVRSFGRDAGERYVSFDGAGRLLDESRPLIADYAVVPAGLGLRGEVVARNPQGRQVLVRTGGGPLRMTAAAGVPRC